MATRTRATLPAPLVPQPRSLERPVSLTRWCFTRACETFETGAMRSEQPLRMPLTNVGPRPVTAPPDPEPEPDPDPEPVPELGAVLNSPAAFPALSCVK